jgi:hypothetical protein
MNGIVHFWWKKRENTNSIWSRRCTQSLYMDGILRESYIVCWCQVATWKLEAYKFSRSQLKLLCGILSATLYYIENNEVEKKNEFKAMQCCQFYFFFIFLALDRSVPSFFLDFNLLLTSIVNGMETY